MAVNFPGPYEVEIPYFTPVGAVTLPHVLRVNCVTFGTPSAGTPVGSIQLQTRAGTPAPLQNCVDGLWNWIRQVLPTVVLANTYQLNRYPVAGSFAKVFIAAGSLTNANGASGSPVQVAMQATYTFISGNGGKMRLQLMESVHGQKSLVPLTANGAGDTNEQIAAYVVSSAGWMLARDDAFPVASKSLGQGENEKLFRQRYR